MEIDLAAGLWPKFLPGGRILAARYGVSRPTIEVALRELARRGLIAGGGQRCRWRVNPGDAGAKSSAKPAVATAGVLLWLGEEHPVVDPLTLEVMEATRKSWESKGGRLVVALVDLPRVRNGTAEVRTLLKRYAATRLILHNAPEPLARAALATGLPVFLLGGDVCEPHLAGIGFSLKLVLSQIIPTLIRKGRRRILIVTSAGRPTWYESMINALRKCDGDSAEDPASWVLEVPQNLPQAVHDMWRRVLPVKRPDAVFSMDARWIVSLYSVAWELGMRPGIDIEAVYFDDSPQLDWLSPPPRAIRASARIFIKRIERWLTHPDKSGGFEFVGIDGAVAPRDSRQTCASS